MYVSYLFKTVIFVFRLKKNCAPKRNIFLIIRELLSLTNKKIYIYIYGGNKVFVHLHRFTGAGLFMSP
jgi:hypothetical protein